MSKKLCSYACVKVASQNLSLNFATISTIGISETPIYSHNSFQKHHNQYDFIAECKMQIAFTEKQRQELKINNILHQ